MVVPRSHKRGRFAPAELSFAGDPEHPGAPVYGLAKVPAGRRVPCGAYCSVFRDEESGAAEMYLGLYVPMSSLGLAYPVGAYPFQGASEWRLEVDSWLVQVARFVFAREEVEERERHQHGPVDEARPQLPVARHPDGA